MTVIQVIHDLENEVLWLLGCVMLFTELLVHYVWLLQYFLQYLCFYKSVGKINMTRNTVSVPKVIWIESTSSCYGHHCENRSKNSTWVDK